MSSGLLYVAVSSGRCSSRWLCRCRRSSTSVSCCSSSCSSTPCSVCSSSCTSSTRPASTRCSTSRRSARASSCRSTLRDVWSQHDSSLPDGDVGRLGRRANWTSYPTAKVHVLFAFRSATELFLAESRFSDVPFYGFMVISPTSQAADMPTRRHKKSSRRQRSQLADSESQFADN